MIKILREADKTPVSEVTKKRGVSDVTIYACRKRFGQLEAVDVRLPRQLEAENARLKKVLAERCRVASRNSVTRCLIEDVKHP